jgi:hypothetical protein
MKYNLRLLVLPLMLLAIWGKSQEVKVTYGRSNVLKDPMIPAYATERALTEDDESVFVCTYDENRSLKLKKINKKTNQTIWEKPFDLPSYKNALFQGLEKVPNGFILFLKKDDNKQRQSYAVAQKLDDNFNAVGEQKVVATVKYADAKKNFYFFIIHKNGNKFLLNTYNALATKREPHIFSVVDDDLNPIWTKTIELPASVTYATQSIGRIDDNGNLIAVFNARKDGGTGPLSTPEKYTATDGFMVCRYEYGKDHIVLEPVDFNGRLTFYSTIDIDIDVKHNAIELSGVYSNGEKKKDDDEGIFSLMIDMNNIGSANYKQVKFSDKVRNGYPGGVKNLVLIRKIRHEDGTRSFILERKGYSLPEYSQNQTGGSFSSTTLSYGALTVITIDAEGNEKWSAFIPKEQYGNLSIPNYYSVYAFGAQNSPVILFNARSGSVTNPDEDGFEFHPNERHEDNVLVIVTFDEKGSPIIKTFTPRIGKKVMVDINSILNLGAGRYVLYFDEVSIKEKLTERLNAILEAK